MKDKIKNFPPVNGINRRTFLWTLSGSILSPLLPACQKRPLNAETFITKAKNYETDLVSIILAGLRELRIEANEIQGKKILLKPNLVEPHQGAGQINTHPLVVRGAIEAFFRLGAAQVIVGEGPGHVRDTHLVLEEAGYVEILKEDRVPFIDFNLDQVYKTPNLGGRTDLKQIILPQTLRQVDWIVSLAKMKTHHWAGATLSMKNLFGVLPGSFYGWPKNILHQVGIEKAIFDITATLRPNLAIIDGIVGMEGDGPIMGTPKNVGVLVLGRNLPAVDATSARIMGINPSKIAYLKMADGRLGPIRERDIQQKGETIREVQTDFALIDKIPAHSGIRG